MKSASKHIPKQTTSAHHNSLYSYLNSSIHKQINKIQKLYYRCKIFSLLPASSNITSHNLFPISSTDHNFILKTAAEHLISSSSLDGHYDNNRLLLYLHELKFDILKLLYAKQLIVSQKENNERIHQFIQRRVDNFKDAPTKMIDSFLERNRKTIVLDRILVNHNTPDQHLALDPAAIKHHTAQYFQSVAGSTNRNVTDPENNNFSPNWPIWER